jgi:alkylation response protein AidB-like acyl-CoA dehydrogenase
MSETYDPVAEARALGPRIRELAPQIDRDRQLPRELVEALLDAGLFHLYLPKDYSGREVDPVTAAKAVEETAFFDGAAGWCLMIAGQNATFSGLIEPEEAKAIWGPRDIVCGTARPIGRAIATNDPSPGYRVSGRWPFASGSSHASWFAGECVVYDGDEPRKDANGNEVTRMTIMPRESVAIHDVWETTGLRGTASNDFSADDVFVPIGRGAALLFDAPKHPWSMYKAFPLVFTNHGSQALGVGRAAVAEARQMANTKVGWGGIPLYNVQRMQSVIAEATVLVESARTYLYAVLQELWDEFEGGRGGTALQRSRLRLATSHAARASLQAVDLLYNALATSAIMRKSPLERQFRDIHTANAHVMVGQLTYEAAGRVELGRDAEFPFF